MELNLDQAETESRSKVLNPTFTFFVKLVIAVTVFIFARQSHLQKQSTKKKMCFTVNLKVNKNFKKIFFFEDKVEC